MGWFTKLLGADKLVDNVMKGADALFTSDEERLKLRNILNAQVQDFALAMQEQITKRHAADMASDSWMSKNIRPYTWLFLTLLLASVVGVDFFISVREPIVQLVQMAWITVTALYIPAREVGKAIINWKAK